MSFYTPITKNGGAGSGNFGHAGRPGERGGSAPTGSGGYTKADQIEDLHKAGQITKAERDELLAKAKSNKTASEQVEKPKSAEELKPKPNAKSQESATEWAKKHIDNPQYLNDKDISFDEIVGRMSAGDDFYNMFGQIDSVDRERVFEETARRTGLGYDDVYNLWQGEWTRAGADYVEALKESPRMRELKVKEKEMWAQRDGGGEAMDRAMSEKERDERYLRDMVGSVWAYDGDKNDNRYLHGPDRYPSLTEKEKSKAIDDEWKYLSEHCITRPAGTDSEGVSYNTVVYAPSLAKKK